MKKETKELLIKYVACFGIAALIAFIVFWMSGFFTDDVGVNIQRLSDGFFVSGFLVCAVSVLLFIADEGGFIGLGFVVRNVILTFIPMGRKNQETYADYRERALAKKKFGAGIYVLVIGILFLGASVVFAIIWYKNFYNIV